MDEKDLELVVKDLPLNKLKLLISALEDEAAVIKLRDVCLKEKLRIEDDKRVNRQINPPKF